MFPPSTVLASDVELQNIIAARAKSCKNLIYWFSKLRKSSHYQLKIAIQIKLKIVVALSPNVKRCKQFQL